MDDRYSALVKHFPTTFTDVVWKVKCGDWVNEGDVLFTAESRMLPFGTLVFKTPSNGFVVFDTLLEKSMTVKGTDKLAGLSSELRGGRPNRTVWSGTNGYYDKYILLSPKHNNVEYLKVPVVSTAVGFYIHPNLKVNRELFKIIDWLNSEGKSFYMAGMGYLSSDMLPRIFINEDYGIDVECQYSSINVRNDGKLPEFIRFNEVDGNFRIDFYPIPENIVTTLRGCPVKVLGNFECERNKLTTLEGSPRHVGGDFVAKTNKLTSFIGMPKYIGGCFNIANNEFDDTAWEYAKENIDGEFCDYNIANNKFVKYRKELY